LRLIPCKKPRINYIKKSCMRRPEFTKAAYKKKKCNKSINTKQVPKEKNDFYFSVVPINFRTRKAARTLRSLFGCYLLATVYVKKKKIMLEWIFSHQNNNTNGDKMNTPLHFIKDFTSLIRYETQHIFYRKCTTALDLTCEPCYIYIYIYIYSENYRFSFLSCNYLIFWELNWTGLNSEMTWRKMNELPRNKDSFIYRKKTFRLEKKKKDL
jgi:hypothetical protein